MANSTLRTDYQDDVLNVLMNGYRRYNVTEYEDGSISLTDVTNYDQFGDEIKGADLNATNEVVNNLNETIGDLATILDAINGEAV